MPLAIKGPEIALVRNQYLAALETVLRLSDELCTAVDCEAEDVGGQRTSGTILGELGPAVDQAKKLRTELDKADPRRRRKGNRK